VKESILKKNMPNLSPHKNTRISKINAKMIVLIYFVIFSCLACSGDSANTMDNVNETDTTNIDNTQNSESEDTNQTDNNGSENAKTQGIWPISNSATPDCIQDPFGHRILSGNDDLHAGIDTCNDDPDDINNTNTGNIVGSNIHAPLDGFVSRIRRWDPDWDINPNNCPSFCRQGSYLMLRHPSIEAEYNNEVVQTIYMHMAQGSIDLDLEVGDPVKQGDILGKVSNTGTGINTVHLHFGMLIGSNEGAIDADDYHNPMVFLPHEDISPTFNLSLDSDVSGFNGECNPVNNRLLFSLNQPSPDIDIIRIEIQPPTGEAEVIDFNEKIGLGVNSSSDRDDFIQGCTAVVVENFNENNQNYTLNISFGGSFPNGEYQLTIHDTQENQETHTYQLASPL